MTGYSRISRLVKDTCRRSNILGFRIVFSFSVASPASVGETEDSRGGCCTASENDSAIEASLIRTSPPSSVKEGCWLTHRVERLLLFAFVIAMRYERESLKKKVNSQWCLLGDDSCRARAVQDASLALPENRAHLLQRLAGRKGGPSKASRRSIRMGYGDCQRCKRRYFKRAARIDRFRSAATTTKYEKRLVRRWWWFGSCVGRLGRATRLFAHGLAVVFSFDYRALSTDSRASPFLNRFGVVDCFMESKDRVFREREETLHLGVDIFVPSQCRQESF